MRQRRYSAVLRMDGAILDGVKRGDRVPYCRTGKNLGCEDEEEREK